MRDLLRLIVRRPASTEPQPPAEAQPECPTCGSPALFLRTAGPIEGSIGEQYRIDEMMCSVCGHIESRRLQLGDGYLRPPNRPLF